jgi:hypothetical protein
MISSVEFVTEDILLESWYDMPENDGRRRSSLLHFPVTVLTASATKSGHAAGAFSPVVTRFPTKYHKRFHNQHH